MRIAIFHNYMDNIGGAEKVVLTLARELRGDIYTTVVNRAGLRKINGEESSVQTIGWIPKNAPIRQQLANLRLRLLNIGSQYDYFIIAGDWALSAAVNHKPNLWYVHSPIREIWDLHHYIRTEKVSAWKRPLFDLWVRYNRNLNRKHCTHAGVVACNSHNTKQRLQRFLGRNDGVVVHPPVDTASFSYRKTGDFWLSVNRLFDHKRVDIQMEAFRRLPRERLVVVGCYEKARHFQAYAAYIRRIKPANVTLLHWLDFPELVKLYGDCKGFITTAMDEDFGLTAVEAMAAGKPVIAPDEGGYRESVLDGITGKLLTPMDPDRLVAAIRELGPSCGDFKEACLERAASFDTRHFIDGIKALMHANTQLQ